MKTHIQSFLDALSSRLQFGDSRTNRAVTKMLEDPDGVANEIVRSIGSDTQILHVGPPKQINHHDISGND